MVETGGSTGLHTTALGKVLLAFQSDDFINTFIKRSGLHPYNPNSITDADQLWAQIRDIRQTKTAINNGEHYEDIAAVAAPVFGRHGQVVAGVSLAYPHQLYPDSAAYQQHLMPLLLEVTKQVNDYTVNRM